MSMFGAKSAIYSEAHCPLGYQSQRLTGSPVPNMLLNTGERESKQHQLHCQSTAGALCSGSDRGGSGGGGSGDDGILRHHLWLFKDHKPIHNASSGSS